ncbi:MAG: hypothetical protein WBH50_09910, partial [Fuerstiella sp.]
YKVAKHLFMPEKAGASVCDGDRGKVSTAAGYRFRNQHASSEGKRRQLSNRKAGCMAESNAGTE